LLAHARGSLPPNRFPRAKPPAALRFQVRV
jgi:hypothetical protein